MSDYLAEIGEAQASGKTAKLYDDIRRQMGVGMVNLIYRHMAARPGVLPWAWGALRPLFAGGAIAAEMGALNLDDDFPAVSAVPRPAWFAAGLNDHSLRTVRMILDDYNRGNLSNLLAIGALARFLADDAPARAPREEDASAAPPPPMRLPPIRSMDEVDDSTAALIRLLSAPLAPAGTRMIPSLYRHLAPWPAWLAMAAAAALTPDVLAGAPEQGRRLHDRAGASIDKLAQAMAPVSGNATPAAEDLAAITALTGDFAAGPIAGMVVLGRRMRATLPEIPRHQP